RHTRSKRDWSSDVCSSDLKIDLSKVEVFSPRGIHLAGQFDIARARFNVPAVSAAVVGMIAPSPVSKGRRTTVIADERNELSIQEDRKSVVEGKGVEREARS